MSLKNNNQGSILIPVMVIFLILAGISTAMIQRSMQNASIVAESTKSHLAYQSSDSLVEEFMQKVRNLDKTSKEIGDNLDEQYIAQNYFAANFCSVNDYVCFNSSGAEIGGSERISDIFYVQRKSDVPNSTSVRSVFAPLLERISLAVDNFEVVSCCPGGDINCVPNSLCSDTESGGYNSSDILIQWRYREGLVGSDADDEVKGFEIRRSMAGKQDIAENSNWWERITRDVGDFNNDDDEVGSDVHVHKKDVCDVAGYDCFYAVVQNDESIEFNTLYYYTIKAITKKNFTLDSLYLDNPVAFSTTSVEGTGEDTCKDENEQATKLYNYDCHQSPLNPPGTDGSQRAGFGYNCSGECSSGEENCSEGSETKMFCWETKPGWRPNGRKYTSTDTNGYGFTDNGRGLNYCPIQVASSSDDVETYPSGTESTGYCVTKQNSFESANLSAPNFAFPDNSIDKNPTTASDTNAYPGDVTAEKDDCDRPYATKGYCKTKPDSSTKNNSFLADSIWRLSNFENVYKGSDSDNETIKPRCSRHDCPDQPENSKCASNIPGPQTGQNVSAWSVADWGCRAYDCGEYNFDIKCTPACINDYIEDEPKYKLGSSYDESDSSDSIYYTGTCCQEDCSNNTPTNCTGAGYACSDTITWSPTTCGACTNNISSVCHNEFYNAGSCSCSQCGTATKVSDCNGGYCNKNCSSYPSCTCPASCPAGKSCKSGTCACGSSCTCSCG